MTEVGPGIPFTVIAFFLVIGPLVFVHEMGHYLVARWFGVKAEAFSIGFGKELFGWTDRRGTRWKVGWLQLGGYVKFAGDMNPASQPSEDWLLLPPEERARTFQAKPVWQRFLIVLAGPAINFLFAILIFMGVFGSYGMPRAVSGDTGAVVAGVVDESAASRAGFELGDRVVSINGRQIDAFEDLRQFIVIRPEVAMEFGIVRDGQPITIQATPEASTAEDQFGNQMRIGRIGLESQEIEFVRPPLLELPGEAVGYTVRTVEMTVVALGQIITGDRSIRELGGPAKIAQLSGQQTSLGLLAYVLFLAAISINLGFINLLPIPLLDGGHLLFYSVEAVRRKPLRPATQEWAFRLGLAFLLTFMLMVTVIDLGSFGLWQRLTGLIG